MSLLTYSFPVVSSVLFHLSAFSFFTLSPFFSFLLLLFLFPPLSALFSLFSSSSPLLLLVSSLNFFFVLIALFSCSVNQSFFQHLSSLLPPSPSFVSACLPFPLFTLFFFFVILLFTLTFFGFLFFDSSFLYLFPST